MSRRTRDLVNELGVELVFYADRPPYISAFVETKKFLETERPSIVFVQLPQGPLLWITCKLSGKLGFKVVADVHSGFVYTTTFKGLVLNKPFNYLLRQTDLVLAHNELQRNYMIDKIKLDEGKTIVVYDPIPKPAKEVKEEYVEDLEPGEYIVFPASWASDEPLDFIVREFLSAKTSSEYKLVITNDYRRNMKLYRRVLGVLGKSNAYSKVVIPGYLDDSKYQWILRNSKAILAATSMEYTMLSAIWEAVGFNKPFIASETNTIRSIVGNYPCLYRLVNGELTKTLDYCLYEINIESTASHTLERLRKISEDSIENLKNRLKNLVNE